MLERLSTHKMVSPADLEPSQAGLKIVGTFNPGAAELGDEVVLLVRVAEQSTETRDGFQPSPRWNLEQNRVEIDWLKDEELNLSDPRNCWSHDRSTVRLRFISHLRVAFSKDGKTIDRFGERILPQGPYETYGLEDPRITKIGSTYFITYVGASPNGAATRLMSTTDFTSFTRHGTIFNPDNKDVVLFPEKVGGDFLAIHRPMPHIPFRPPQMWLARSPDLHHWGHHEALMHPDCGDFAVKVGGGTPPIRTDRGWFTLFHGVSEGLPDKDASDTDPSDGKQETDVFTSGEQAQVQDQLHEKTKREASHVYRGGSLLLDHDRPTKVIAHSAEAMMEPEEEFEKLGFFNNVVFPTGLVERDDRVLVYYGAADEHVGVAEYDRAALLGTVEG